MPNSVDRIDILMVEDNPADVRLAQEAFKYQKLSNPLNIVKDGVEAIKYLRKEGRYAEVARPDIILLDLNLPRMSGQEVLKTIKEDENLSTIPVVILSTSDAEKDILKAYQSHANCYITKPVDFEKFADVVRQVEGFWFSVVKLPNAK